MGRVHGGRWGRTGLVRRALGGMGMGGVSVVSPERSGDLLSRVEVSPRLFRGPGRTVCGGGGNPISETTSKPPGVLRRRLQVVPVRYTTSRPRPLAVVGRTSKTPTPTPSLSLPVCPLPDTPTPWTVTPLAVLDLTSSSVRTPLRGPKPKLRGL